MPYAAVYLDVKGRQRSAGTFASEGQATRAWQKAEEKIAEAAQVTRAVAVSDSPAMSRSSGCRTTRWKPVPRSTVGAVQRALAQLVVAGWVGSDHAGLGR
jgi:hypothetical protein